MVLTLTTTYEGIDQERLDWYLKRLRSTRESGFMNCRKCKKSLEPHEAYEYRGAISCAEHFEEVEETRNHERREIIAAESRKTDVFRGLDLGESVVGKANRKLLAPQIEIASKESARLRAYK